MAVILCRSGAVEAAPAAAPEEASPEAGQFAEAPPCGEALRIEGERWLDRGWSARPLSARPRPPAATVIRTIKIAARAPTMVAEFIQGAQSSEAALRCEAELQSEGGVQLLPVVADAVVDAGGKHSGRPRLLDRM
jgi:hypothetical protein